MPEPPRFAPVDALLPPLEPSVSQYKIPAPAVPWNADRASTAELTTPNIRNKFLYEYAVGFVLGFFKISPKDGTYFVFCTA